MPSKDRGHEYMRIRTRKDRDKDRDGDTPSASGICITTIRDRKHRKSSSSHASATEMSRQSSNTTHDDHLPPLSETEESEYASASTSPILKTNSNVTTASSPPSIKTPPTLQPYLEEPDDTASTIMPPNKIGPSQEWIGPQVENEGHADEAPDAITPTPKHMSDPMASLDTIAHDPHPDKAPQRSTSPVEKPASDKAKLSSSNSKMVYAWATSDSRPNVYFHPSPMTNPGLPPGQDLPMMPQQPPPRRSEPSHEQPLPGAPPSPVRPPTRVQERRPQPKDNEPRRESRPEYPPPANIQYATPSPHTPPMPDISIPPQGMLMAMPPTPTTMLMPPNPNALAMPPNPNALAMSPGPNALAMPPNPTTVAIHHPQPEPLPYPSVPARMEHPANILYRVANVIPDLTALIDMYHGTAGMVHARDQYISDLEARKATESERLNKRIDSLTRDIQSMIRHHESQERELQDEASHWEGKHKRMQEGYARERKHKEDAVRAHKTLNQVHEVSKTQHQEVIENMTRASTQEKERTTAAHAGDRQHLTEQIAQAARNTEESIASLKETYEADRQNQEARWQRYLRVVQDDHAKARQELEDTIQAKEKLLKKGEDDHAKARDNWEKDRQTLWSQWEDDRASLKRAAEEQQLSLSAQHLKAMDDMQHTMDSMLAHREMEANKKLAKCQQERDQFQDRLDETLNFHQSEIQSANETFRREKDEYSRTMESAAARQFAELQAEIRDLRKEKDGQGNCGDASRTRQLRDAQETISKLQKETDELMRSRGVSHSRQTSEAKEMMAKGRKENEALPADRVRLVKSKTEDLTSSRSSTPGPKEDRLERSRSNRGSGVPGTSTNPKSSRGEEGYRSHHRDRTS